MAYYIGIDARCLEGERTGTGRYLYNVLRHLGASKDFAFTLYFKHEIPTDAYFQEYAYKLRRLEPSFGVESNALFTHVDLPRALKQDHADLLFAPAYIAPWHSPVPTVVVLHDISYAAHPEWVPWAERMLLRCVSKHAAKYAMRIVTVSNFTKAEIVRHYRLPQDRIVVTPLAADPVFVPQATDTDAKDTLTKLNIPGDFFLSVGIGINRRYPVETIEAFVAVAKKFPVLQLVLVGGDRTYPPLYLQKHIARTNQTLGRQAVLALPHVSDAELGVLYRKAKALVWLSAYEGFGLPPLEALAVGTPVITSNTSSLPETVGEAAIKIGEPEGAISSTTGISLAGGPTVGAIADAMRRVLTDELLRQWLIAKGKTQAQKFSWKTTAEQTLEVFKDILIRKRT